MWCLLGFFTTAALMGFTLWTRETGWDKGTPTRRAVFFAAVWSIPIVMVATVLHVAGTLARELAEH